MRGGSEAIYWVALNDNNVISCQIASLGSGIPAM